VTTQLQMGTPVHCTDGALGELADIVLVPGSRRVTHIVVAPRHHRSDARLVPFALIASDSFPAPEILVACTLAEAHAMDEVQEYAYVRMEQTPPLDDDASVVGIQDLLTVPSPPPGSFQLGPWRHDPSVSVTYDRIPRGEVEVRRASEVTGADGSLIGRLDGLSVDVFGTITEVVLEYGHVWGRRRVSIPAGAVAQFDMDGMTLALSKDQMMVLMTPR
jgi:hypothetical protein